MNARTAARRYDSVQQDWRAILPEAKSSLFADHCGQLENAYLMLSVQLNEAISARNLGDVFGVRQGAGVLQELCARLALRINAVLHAMGQQARHLDIVPNLAQLDAANFRTAAGQRAARLSNLVGHVLLSERSQFLNKLIALEGIVDKVGDEFIESSRHLASQFSAQVTKLWECLDLNHFDLNTCLRETDVLLKSFLCVLPEDQLTRFDFTISGLARTRRPRIPATSFDLIRPGRITAVAGE